MFHIGIDYPSFDEEIDVVQNSTSAYTPQLQRVLSAAKILHLQTLVRQVPATRSVVGYAGRLARVLLSISFWVPRRVPSCTDALPLPSTMSGRWLPLSCAIVS